MKAAITASTLTLLLVASAFAQSRSDDSIRVVGTIQPAASFAVKPAVDGRIKRLHVHAGDRVKAGDLLIEIDARLVEETSKLKVLAPIEGTILSVPVIERQAVVSDGVFSRTTLMTIADLSKLVIDAHVPQADITRLTSKQAVQFTTDSTGAEKTEATISFIAPIATVENTVKGFRIQAVIEKPNQRLRPGMTAKLTIPVSTPTSK